MYETDDNFVDESLLNNGVHITYYGDIRTEKFPQGTVTFNAAAAASVETKANGAYVTVSLNAVNQSTLTVAHSFLTLCLLPQIEKYFENEACQPEFDYWKKKQTSKENDNLK